MYSRKVVFSLLGFVLSLSTVTHAQQWPSFRGPAAGGVLDATVPTQWDAATGDGIRWRTAIPGLSHASPIVWEDRVYVVSAVRLDGASTLDRQAQGVVFAQDTVRHAWRLYALDRASGRIIWDRTAVESAPRQGRHVRGTYANATPVTNGRAIVASLGYEGLFCFNLDGSVRWRVPGLPDHTNMYDPASSPVIHDNLVIVQNDWKTGSHLAAYDLASGREVWRVTRDEGMTWASPTIVGTGASARLIVNSPRTIRAHDPQTGKELWRLDNQVAQPWDRIPTPFASGDLAIIAGGGSERPIFAVKPDASGDLTLTAGPTSGVAWTTERGSPYMATPVAYQGLLYAIGQNGVLAAFDLADGTRVYQQRVGRAGSIYTASPVAAGGHLYLTSEDGEVTVVRAGREFSVVRTNRLNDVVFATPALVPGGLIFRTSGQVIAIGAPDASRSDDERALLALHEITLAAHRQRSIDQLLKDEHDDYVVANAGEISSPTLAQRRAFFEPYFSSTTFTEYRDLRAPIVKVSADGTLGWVVAQVGARGEQRRADGTTQPIAFESAWIELYEKRTGVWVRVGNVSNFKQ